MTLGEKVHLWRRRRGWTQKVLSAQIGVNTNYLAKLERGEVKDPAGSIVWRLARTLGVSTDYLLDTEREGSEERTAAPVG